MALFIRFGSDNGARRVAHLPHFARTAVITPSRLSKPSAIAALGVRFAAAQPDEFGPFSLLLSLAVRVPWVAALRRSRFRPGSGGDKVRLAVSGATTATAGAGASGGGVAATNSRARWARARLA